MQNYLLFNNHHRLANISSRELFNQCFSGIIEEEEEEEEEEDRFCRVCYDDESQGILISPCLCKNSIGFIHYECLKEWRKTSHRIITGCEICKFEYQFYKPKAYVTCHHFLFFFFFRN